ncbi:hypothetical protein J3F83DRAFT_721610 [Trichoderma novae-zelandiae]
MPFRVFGPLSYDALSLLLLSILKQAMSAYSMYLLVVSEAIRLITVMCSSPPPPPLTDSYSSRPPPSPSPSSAT